MPIYEFICDSCNQQFETILPSTDVSSVTCTECHSPAVKKILSTGSFKMAPGGSRTAASPPPAPDCGRSGFS